MGMGLPAHFRSPEKVCEWKRRGKSVSREVVAQGTADGGRGFYAGETLTKIQLSI